MLEFIDVSKAYGAQVLLSKVSFRIGEGDRIGLVGANGSGKTTLFRLAVGEEFPDSGTIQKKKGITIGYLPQEVDVQKQGAVLDEVLSALPEYHRVYRQICELDAVERGGGGTAELREERVDLAIQYEQLGGDGVRAEAGRILFGLGFSPGDLMRPLSTLSGGWHMRVNLAKLLIARPDLLLLDEPLNHLDLPSILWLEEYLKGFKGAYVIVAHDREFLNRAVRRIIEVDHGTLTQYSGNYDVYRRRKEEDFHHRVKAYKTQRAKIREVEEFIARNRARKDRARQVQSRLKMLEKMEKLTEPVSPRELVFSFPQPERSGSQVLHLVGISLSFGAHRVFDGVDLVLNRGDKVAVVGVNGMGKSTLLKIAAGVLPPDCGERKTGHNVSVGYFAQHQLEALRPERTVLEEIYTVVRGESLAQVRSLLGAFLFTGSDVEKKVSLLSGGEKSRLALAKLMIRPANLLIMDEPTSHLDIASREVLELALSRYSGTLLFSSHDRRFIDAIADRVIEVDRGMLTEYCGNYSYYAWKKGADKGAAAQIDVQRSASDNASSKRTVRDERRERKRLEAELRNEIYRLVKPIRDKVKSLEKSISEMESQIAKLETELADPTLYSYFPDQVREKVSLLARLRRELDKSLEEWGSAILAAEETEAEIRGRMEQQGITVRLSEAKGEGLQGERGPWKV